MNQNPVNLTQPLPAAVAVGGNRWWLSYRNFPVFSAPWLLRRFTLFSIFVILWESLNALIFMVSGISGADVLRLSGYRFAAYMTMIHSGPVMATLVRHNLPWPRLEKAFVICALAAGLGFAFMADMLAAARVYALLGLDGDVEFSASLALFNVSILLAIYGVLGGGLALRAYLTESRRLAKETMRREKGESERRLERLQAQVEPHFLFNTLGTVRSSIRSDPGHAEATLDALCDYLRATIPRLRAGETQSELGDQLDVCRYYLQVMKMRMRERLEFGIEVDEALRTHPFPPFMLLSLVENAIKHGLEPRAEGGRVDLRASAENGSLAVEVVDDGVGLSAGVGTGVGLRNIREQLRLRYGQRAGLSLEGHSSGGVRARLEIPLESR